MSVQRIRDPLHDLIQFSNTELERILWDVLKTRPFQRLRRVKQLGFSDLVYPGASHSRFAHSVGVFHTARMLMDVVREKAPQRVQSKEDRALAAALVHDLGHGPFSHAFEKVGKRLDLKLADHENTSDILIRDSEVSGVLNQIGTGFAADVADIIKKDGVKSIQHAVVSSQFDADRLDYMRRDRLMTGTQHAAIDFSWLIANLEIGSVQRGVDDQPLGNIETFVLGPKAIHAAEAFVLGLFQLYPTVYLHKATRGAELLFVELLVQFVYLVKNGSVAETGLPENHPLVVFAKHPDNIDAALALDDTVVWGALSQIADANDALLSEFSVRLRDRKLFSCIDVRLRVGSILDPTGKGDQQIDEQISKCCALIGQKLSSLNTGSGAVPKVLIDGDARSPYKPVGQSKGPLDRINIRTESNRLVDLSERSHVVAALRTFRLYRAYVSRNDRQTVDAVNQIIDTESRKWRTQLQ